MINFDFDFVQPSAVEIAIKTFYADEDKKKMYVSGATEFISRARMCEITPRVVIDTKFIPECNVFEQNEEHIIIGSAVPLNKIIDANPFPLLTDVCRGIASRTARNKITLGGNLLSDLPYRETMLPLLLANSQLVIATSNGIEKRNMDEIGKLAEGELLLQTITDKQYLNVPYQYRRKTRQSNLNYPIITAAALREGDIWRFAFSGLCHEPLCERKLNEKINAIDLKSVADMSGLVDYVPGEVLDDMNASRGFRTYLFRVLLHQMIIEGDKKE